VEDLKKVVQKLEQRLALFESKSPVTTYSDLNHFDTEKLKKWNDENDRRIKLMEQESKLSIANKITETEAMYEIRALQQRKEHH
jgi:hypothetical protein